MVIRIGRSRVRPAVSTASRSGMLVAAPQDVGVVDEQDRVADDDARQHDDADVGLQAERRAGELQREHDADRRERHREHDDERIAQRLGTATP